MLSGIRSTSAPDLSTRFAESPSQPISGLIGAICPILFVRTVACVALSVSVLGGPVLLSLPHAIAKDDTRTTPADAHLRLITLSGAMTLDDTARGTEKGSLASRRGENQVLSGGAGGPAGVGGRPGCHHSSGAAGSGCLSDTFLALMSAWMKFSEATGDPASRRSIASWPAWVIASASGPCRNWVSVMRASRSGLAKSSRSAASTAWKRVISSAKVSTRGGGYSPP